MKRKIYISGVTLLLVLIIFLFFPNLLLLQLFDTVNFPLGTLITWIGFISLNSFFYYQFYLRIKTNSRSAFVIQELFKLWIRIGYCWGIIGFLLAANWSMSFSGSISTFRGSYDASLVYWGFNYILFLTPILLFLISWILKKSKLL